MVGTVESLWRYPVKSMARNNLVAILIYIAAIGAAFIYLPLALVMIALPAIMYFLPERALEKFEHLA